MSVLEANTQTYSRVMNRIYDSTDRIDQCHPGVLFLAIWFAILLALFLAILPGLIFLFIWKLLRWAGLSNGWVFLILLIITGIVALIFVLNKDLLIKRVKMTNNGIFSNY